MVLLEENGQWYIASELETFDPITNAWLEVVAPGTASVTIREKGGGADMPGIVWPLTLTSAGAGTKRWYAPIDATLLTPDVAEHYEAFLEGDDQDGAHFESTEPILVRLRRSMVVPD
jgi:hypothetical protein